MITITFSYSRADVKQWTRIFVREVSGRDGILEDEARRITMTELDLTRWLRSHPAAFYSIEEPWAFQLARWAFAQAVKLGYLAEVEDKPGFYCLTAKALKLQ
ncbi:MAG: hypothetical protein IJV05_06025 [Muribaculaceae bacterium]|nr:hypothetical protein [Muribaculaceae bacterium]